MSRTPEHAWVNGRLVDAATAAVSLHDRGLRSGEGVFETLRTRGGIPWRLDAHVARARAGMQALRLESPPAEVLREAVLGVLEPLDANTAWAVRLIVTPGVVEVSGPWPPKPHPSAVPTVLATAHRIDDHDDDLPEVSAITLPLRRSLPRIKTLSYSAEMLALREAAVAGADTALLVDTDHEVREAATANVIARFGARIVTAPDDGRILAGITRADVLDLLSSFGLDVEQRGLHRREILLADEVILTSSIAGVTACVEVDGETIGDGTPGLLVTRLRAAHLALTSRAT